MCNIFKYKAHLLEVSNPNKLKNTVERATFMLDSKLDGIIISTEQCCYQVLRNGFSVWRGGGPKLNTIRHILHYLLLLASFGPIRNHFEIRLLTCLETKHKTLTL
jgi:hypothetical protein